MGAWVFVAAFAPWIAPHSPTDLDVMNRLEPPGPIHLFGTDEAGRDNFSRVLYGARITIPVAFTVILLASLFGAGVGAVAGYVGGRVDEVLMRVVDIVLAFPPIVLAMAITAALGAGLRNAMFAILLVSWPEFSRLMRGQVLAIKENDYVIAARALGAPGWPRRADPRPPERVSPDRRQGARSTSATRSSSPPRCRSSASARSRPRRSGAR